MREQGTKVALPAKVALPPGAPLHPDRMVEMQMAGRIRTDEVRMSLLPRLNSLRRKLEPPSGGYVKEGARWIDNAIARIDCPSARPREISSRLDRLGVKRERRRGEGSMPPVDESTLWIESSCFPDARSMSFVDCPRLHRSQSSFFCETLILTRRFFAICTISWVMS